MLDLVTDPPEIDEINTLINNCIYSALDASVKPKATRPDYWKKKYWTESLQQAAELRDRSYKKWRRTIGIDKLHWYTQHRDACRSKIQAAKRASWKHFVASIEVDFKKATAAIKRRNASTATFAHENGPATAVEIMSNHLASVYNGALLNPASTTSVPVISDTDHPFPLPTGEILSTNNIKHHLQYLAKQKAPGPDHIKAEMLQPLQHLICTILSALFQLCWQWSYTPLLWRQATVFPIHKKGDASNPGNFRPISLTSVMRKLFEKVISAFVLDNSPILDIAQGSFRPQRSPLDQALCLHDLVYDYQRIHNHLPVIAFLDIKAAYDTVDRRIIWRALENTATFPCAALALLMNMFDDVQISVLISNHVSTPFAPATGVLQGSVLSPHLYYKYINSLPALLRSAASATTTR